MKVRLTARAEADLEAIRDYLVPRSPQGAERVRQSIEASIDLLGSFPGMGHETDIAYIRMLPVVHYPYLIYHTVASERVDRRPHSPQCAITGHRRRLLIGTAA